MDGYSINKTEFGERIKSAREELKMTQTQLAQLLKTSQTTVAKYEHGEQNPPRRRSGHNKQSNREKYGLATIWE